MKRLQLMIPLFPLLISIFLVLSWHQNDNLIRTSQHELMTGQRTNRLLFPGETKIEQMDLQQLKQLGESLKKMLVELQTESSSSFTHHLSVNLERSISLHKSLNSAESRLNQINEEQKETNQAQETSEIQRLTQEIRKMLLRSNQIKESFLNKYSGDDQPKQSNLSPRRNIKQKAEVKAEVKAALQMRVRELRSSSRKSSIESGKQSEGQGQQQETKEQREYRLKRRKLRRQAKLSQAQSMAQQTTNQLGEEKQMRPNTEDPKIHHHRQTSSLKVTQEKFQTAPTTQDKRFHNALRIIAQKATFTSTSNEQCQSLRRKINQLRLAQESAQSQKVKDNLAGKGKLAEKMYSVKCSPFLINAVNYKKLQQLQLEVKKQIIASFQMKQVLKHIPQPLSCISSELNKIVEALFREIRERIDDRIQERNAAVLSQVQLYKLLWLAEDQIQKQKAQEDSRNIALRQQKEEEEERKMVQKAKLQRKRIRIKKQKQQRQQQSKQDRHNRIILDQFGDKCQKNINQLMVFLFDLSKIQSCHFLIEMKLQIMKINQMLLRADLLMEELKKDYEEMIKMIEKDKKILQLMKNKYDNVIRINLLVKKDMQQKMQMIKQCSSRFSGKIKSGVLKQPYSYERIDQKVSQSDQIQDSPQEQLQSPTSSFSKSVPTSVFKSPTQLLKIFSQSAPASLSSQPSLPSSQPSPPLKIFSQSAPTSPSTTPFKSSFKQSFKKLSHSAPTSPFTSPPTSPPTSPFLSPFTLPFTSPPTTPPTTPPRSPEVLSIRSRSRASPSPPPMGVGLRMSPQKKSLLASLSQMKEEDKQTALKMPLSQDQYSLVMYKLPG